MQILLFQKMLQKKAAGEQSTEVSGAKLHLWEKASSTGFVALLLCVVALAVKCPVWSHMRGHLVPSWSRLLGKFGTFKMYSFAGGIGSLWAQALILQPNLLLVLSRESFLTTDVSRCCIFIFSTNVEYISLNVKAGISPSILKLLPARYFVIAIRAITNENLNMQDQVLHRILQAYVGILSHKY